MRNGYQSILAVELRILYRHEPTLKCVQGLVHAGIMIETANSEKKSGADESSFYLIIIIRHTAASLSARKIELMAQGTREISEWKNDGKGA